MHIASYFNPQVTEFQMAGDVNVKAEAARGLSLSFFSGVKYEHLVAGLTGGVLATLATHPFDLIKLRFAGEMTRQT